MRTSPDPPSASVCPNWIFSNASNVHACKDRGWFTEYTPFESSVGSIYTNRAVSVAGVGTVELSVKRSPNLTGSRSQGKLILRNVLHCPSITCNIIGYPLEFEETYDVTFCGGDNGKSKGAIKDNDGRSVAYFAPNQRLFQVKLSGRPGGPVLGPSALSDDGVAFMINVQWPDSEQARWEAYKQNLIDPADHNPKQDRPRKRLRRESSQQTNNPPYTTEEREWLKTHYGNEHHFLLSYALKMHNEEDRAEGRNIVRALMSGKSDD